jgi:hypothetical protein
VAISPNVTAMMKVGESDAHDEKDYENQAGCRTPSRHVTEAPSLRSRNNADIDIFKSVEG